MQSPMLKTQNPPTQFCKKWTPEEEAQLLQELHDNMDIDTIAQTHNRTIGGIQSRQREIAYKMHTKNVPMEEIMEKTKLDLMSIQHTINKKQNAANKKTTEKTPPAKTTVETEIAEIKKEIGELKLIKQEIREMKNTIKQLVDMMQSAVFENV